MAGGVLLCIAAAELVLDWQGLRGAKPSGVGSRALCWNVVGVIRVTNALLPMLRRAGSPRIVNVSSTVGSLTLQTAQAEAVGPISAVYSPTKTYLNAITIQYAKELAGTGILIKAGSPRFVATDLNGHRGTRTPQQGAAIFLQLATLPDDGPSGTFRDDTGIQPW